MTARYGIAERFGRPFERLSVSRRQAFARAALGHATPPPCPFRRGQPACDKVGGVCSIQKGRNGVPVITCPVRFNEGNLLPRWLARIVSLRRVYLAREVPFMRSPSTDRAAARIDFVVAKDGNASVWFGLEVQAAYFSGKGMHSDFEILLTDDSEVPPEPGAKRRPDWRSSSAKRLIPQLQVKGPTLRRWGTTLAVAVDQPFFDAVGGPSAAPSQDLNDDDIVWMVPRIEPDFRLTTHHWEVLSLEASCEKLLSAETVGRQEFEQALRARLEPLGEAI